MRNASHVTYAEARVTGKKRCPVCIGGEDETGALAEAEAEAEASGYYVYATPKGTYYHVNSTCSGMKDAQQVLLADMLRKGPRLRTCSTIFSASRRMPSGSSIRTSLQAETMPESRNSGEPCMAL